MGMPGFGEWALILGALVLLFGGKKLPGLGSAVGESIRNFKKGLHDPEEDKKKLEAEKVADGKKVNESNPPT